MFQTSAELKIDALRLAGEPQDGSSQYDALVYSFMTSVQRALISGGLSIGPVALQPFDWWWARAYPRGVITIGLPINGDYGINATFTQGSATVTLDQPLPTPPLTPNLNNWRIWIDTVSNTVATRPIISIGTPGNLTIQLAGGPWPDATVTTNRWLAWQSEYDLPTDFIRFTSPIFVSGWPYQLDVLDVTGLERSYPFSVIYAGVPVASAMVTQSKIRFSHFLGTTLQGAPVDAMLQVEFEYTQRPPDLGASQDPTFPLEHRRVLSYGAAWLMLEDKSDQRRDRLGGRFQMEYKSMKDAHRHAMRAMSARWGVVVPRDMSEPRRLRTESGVVVWF